MTNDTDQVDARHMRQRMHQSYVYALQQGIKDLTDALMAVLVQAEYSEAYPNYPDSAEMLKRAYAKMLKDSQQGTEAVRVSTDAWRPLSELPDDYRRVKVKHLMGGSGWEVTVVATYRYDAQGKEHFLRDLKSGETWEDFEGYEVVPEAWLPLDDE